MDYRGILKEYWNYDDFRGVQREIIESIGSGRDTLGLMPTGGGKSITFQVPALAKDGLALVVTPLIALMKDQVANLKGRGIRAAAIYAGLSRQEVLYLLEDCIFGGYKFLYISPERLGSELFRTKLMHMKVSMIVVDESHCISQWGYDFRPAYLEISEIRRLLPGVPVLALTATATPKVTDDIQYKLGFREHNVIRMSFNRDNLWYVVRKTDNKIEELKRILAKVPGSGIVYVRSRRRTKEISDELTASGISSQYFHAGLEQARRDLIQKRWSDGQCRIIVSTNAFGMGIDKPDVRSVIHYDMPDSIEAYFQEAGRAGRDGKTSYAVLLHGASDSRGISKRLSDSFPPKEFIRKVYDKLSYMYQMAVGDGKGCTSQFSLSEFCQLYELPVLQTENALRLLTRMGYVEYVEESEYSARVKFISSREDLYRIRDIGSDHEEVMRTVLRLYSGVFSDFADIDEDLVALRSGVGKDKIYGIFTDLQHSGVISYIPRRRTPLLRWTRSRVDGNRLVFDPEVYENRKAEFKARLDAMTGYATRINGCRTQMLLEYFGERVTRPCMRCDLCLERHGSGLSSGLYMSIRTDIMELLAKGTATVDDVSRLPYPHDQICAVLDRLFEEEEVCMTDGKILGTFRKIKYGYD